MTKANRAEIITPPNILKAKLGGTGRGLDMAAIKRATAALERLKVEFEDWMAKDVERLVGTRNDFAAKDNEATRDGLYRASQDLKAQALTFEFPLAARVAASLCRLLDGDGANLTLIDAHVNAIRVIVKQNIRDQNNEMARTLAAELEDRVKTASI